MYLHQRTVAAGTGSGGRCRTLAAVVPGEGHMSTFYKKAADILETLVTSVVPLNDTVGKISPLARAPRNVSSASGRAAPH